MEVAENNEEALRAIDSGKIDAAMARGSRIIVVKVNLKRIRAVKRFHYSQRQHRE
jgi:ABC-type methionine transport system permease subunit